MAIFCPFILKGKGAGFYSLISSLKTYHPFLTFYHWSLDLFICVQLQLHGDHTVLQPFRRIGLLVHIVISVLPGTYFYLSPVKHLRVKCIAQGHNIPRLRGGGGALYVSENPAPSGARNRTTGSDIGESPRSASLTMNCYIFIL